VVTLLVVACAVAFSLTLTMLRSQSVAHHLAETPVVVGEWLLEWSDGMRMPASEEQAQVRALRYVAGGAAALVSALCLLIVAGLWRQRLLLRKAEFFVHWAVGARRLQLVARLLGESRAWVGGAIVVTVMGSATIAALIERTFPGAASVSADVPTTTTGGSALVTASGRLRE
jgi:hypothetical protein